MTEAKIVAFVVAILIAVGLFILQSLTLSRKLRRTLSARSPVQAENFGAHYYSDPRKAEIATFLLVKLNELTGYDFTGAIPEDHFIQDLLLEEIDSLATVEIVSSVESHFAIQITEAEASRVRSVNDFVDLIAAKTASC